MSYALNNSDEFERLIEGLSNDIVHAKIYYDLFRNLQSEVEEYEREFNQTPAFWSLTFHAHWESSIIRLCRAYDQQDNALHLHSWLKIIQQNVHLFEIERFRERLKDNDFVDSLSQRARKPNSEQLTIDLEKVNPSDPLVKKLIILRNNVYAHRSAKGAIRDINFFKDHSIQYSEIEILLDRAVEILNRYSRLFHATTYSTQLVGRNDYEFILKSIRSELERRDKRIDRQLQ